MHIFNATDTLEKSVNQMHEFKIMPRCQKIYTYTDTVVLPKMNMIKLFIMKLWNQKWKCELAF